MSKEFQARPSSLVSVSDPFVAYCLDESVYLFGRHVENKMDEAEATLKGNKVKPEQRIAKRRAALDSCLTAPVDDTEPVATRRALKPPPGRFRDPAAFMGGGKRG